MERENKKSLILHTAIEIIYEKGFNATTTAEIAKKAGVAEGTIFRHYKTKKDILLNIFENFAELLCTKIIIDPVQDILDRNKEKDMAERLRMLIKNRLSIVQQNSELVWIALTEIRYHPEMIELIFEQLAEKAFPLLHQIFEPSHTKDILREYDRTTMARAFMGLLLSVLVQSVVLKMPSEFSVNNLDDFLDEAIDIFLYGILKHE